MIIVRVPKILWAHLILWEREEFEPEAWAHVYWECSWHNTYGPEDNASANPMLFIYMVPFSHIVPSPSHPVCAPYVHIRFHHYTIPFDFSKQSILKHHSCMHKFMCIYISSQSCHHGSVAFCIKLSHCIRQQRQKF